MKIPAPNAVRRSIEGLGLALLIWPLAAVVAWYGADCALALWVAVRW